MRVVHRMTLNGERYTDCFYTRGDRTPCSARLVGHLLDFQAIMALTMRRTKVRQQEIEDRCV